MVIIDWIVYFRGLGSRGFKALNVVAGAMRFTSLLNGFKLFTQSRVGHLLNSFLFVSLSLFLVLLNYVLVLAPCFFIYDCFLSFCVVHTCCNAVGVLAGVCIMFVVVCTKCCSAVLLIIVWVFTRSCLVYLLNAFLLFRKDLNVVSSTNTSHI